MTLTAEGREVAREIMQHLRDSRSPVREDLLHERMALKVDPEKFIGVLEQLEVRGEVGMHVDHDPPINLPKPEYPFSFRYWYVATR
jgi:hypothetical protein